MSRVAKKPILLPDNVEITIGQNVLTVKGPKGSLSQTFNKNVSVSNDQENKKKIIFKAASNEGNAWAQAGTIRSIVNNMINGVIKGYELSLDLVGVGYRAQAKGKSIALSLGFSHSEEYLLPQGVTAETPSNTQIILKGIDKQLLGQVAAEIRSYRPPEPYKGKGVKYTDEVIIRKEAKKK